MKRGWKKIAVGILAGCMLCTTALAYECYITPSYQSVSRGAVVSSTTETNGIVSELYALVALLDENMETIDSASRTKADPTTTSLTASVQAYDGTLKHGKMYTIVGGGYIKYMTKYGLVQQPEDIGESISRKTFTYNGRSAEPVLSDSMPEAMLDYQEERADWIFQKFEMNPDDYNYAWFYELSSYVGTDAFVTIFDIIDLPAGATSDSYFVNNAMDTVYCVFQDKDAVNYLYEFTKEDDVWQLSKVETRQDEGKYSETQQSYADYEQQLLGA